jgi:pimeloyl-ACP methyl ester carboxylesterase
VARPFPHVAGVEHGFVQARGVRLHFAEAGEGEPLVLIHGWPQHWWQWRELIPPLAQRHRVICPDLRGFGWSQAPGHGYDPDTFAADLVALLDELGLRRVGLIGHDWGGLASFIACLRHPERVSRLLALNIVHPWSHARPSVMLRHGWRSWYQVALAFSTIVPGGLNARRIAVINRRIRAASARPECWDGGVLEEFTDQLREPERADATAKLYRHSLLRLAPAIARGRYRELRLTTPTLLVHGSLDFAIPPELLEGYEPYADEMRVELVPDTGHYIVDERPDLVLDRASSFFSEPRDPT